MGTPPDNLLAWHRGLLIPLDEPAVTTTEGLPFTWRQLCQLAYMVWVRFGRDTVDATAAWSRMMQSSATEQDFWNLARKGAELAGEDT